MQFSRVQILSELDGYMGIAHTKAEQGLGNLASASKQLTKLCRTILRNCKPE